MSRGASGVLGVFGLAGVAFCIAFPIYGKTTTQPSEAFKAGWQMGLIAKAGSCRNAATLLTYYTPQQRDEWIGGCEAGQQEPG
jgi:hypothetical protein